MEQIELLKALSFPKEKVPEIAAIFSDE